MQDAVLGKFFQGVGYLAADVAIGIPASQLFMMAVNLYGDLRGALFGRSLNGAERALAHAVFGDRINLTHIKVVEGDSVLASSSAGLAAGGTILLRHSPLSKEGIGTFIHELTHQYQNQSQHSFKGRPEVGTAGAAREKVDHMVTGHDAYKVVLTEASSWRSLGVEQQAAVVENYLERLEHRFSTRPADQKPSDPIPSQERAHYDRILKDAGLFQNRFETGNWTSHLE